MAVFIKQSDGYYKFYTDSSKRFICVFPNKKENVLITDVTDEFDAVCTDNGVMHFLIQSAKGELIYLKFNSDVWTKYYIFKNKDNECKIKNISLTFSKNSLCAFYTIEHGGKFMLTKHKFSDKNLYMTPEIADITDSKRDFCVFTDFGGNTHLFYRDATGKYQEQIFDENFVKKSHSRKFSSENIFSYSAIYDNEKRHSVYVSAKKNYIVLTYSGGNENEEKIITFGIRKNTVPIIFSDTEKIHICWRENSGYMHSESSDGGQSFSRPKQMSKNTIFEKIRFCHRQKGFLTGDVTLFQNFSETIGFNKERGAKVSDKNSNIIYNEKSGAEFTYMLSKIEKDVSKIGKDLDRICMFLSEIAQFKSDMKKEESKEYGSYIEDSGIGEIDEKNVKLFESMDIDEVLPMSENQGESIQENLMTIIEDKGE